MRQFPLWLCALILLPISSLSIQRAKPPGIVTADQQSNQGVEPPMAAPKKKLNVEQVKQEADELKKLADGVPAQIELVTKNQYPKDLNDNLKRIDTGLGPVIHRGNDLVGEFPEQLHLSFLMYDIPCEYQIQSAGTRTHLTHELVSTLRLSFFWKRGMQMRPVTGIVPKHFETRPVAPYARELAGQLPEKFEWIFEFDVPSAAVPVTDSLVVVLRTPDGHIAARAAARM